MVTTSPSLARRHIGEQLESLRLRAGFSKTEVAHHVGKTAETIRRWERGLVPVNVSYIRDLCRLYRAPNALMSRLTSLASDAKTPGLFEGPLVPMEHKVLWENEISAESIRSVELQNIPGLLQTPDYQRAIQSRLLPVSEEIQKIGRKMRARRQVKVVDQPNPPTMEFYVSRAALDYLDEFPEIREGQLAKLRELAAKPFITIGVLTGFHAAMLGSFTLITPRPESLGAKPFVYIESAHGGSYEEGQEVVAIYDRILSTMSEIVIPLEEHLP